MKGQAADWEKIFINHISDKGHVFRIYIVTLKTIRKQTTQFKKMTKDKFEMTLD